MQHNRAHGGAPICWVQCCPADGPRGILIESLLPTRLLVDECPPIREPRVRTYRTIATVLAVLVVLLSGFVGAHAGDWQFDGGRHQVEERSSVSEPGHHENVSHHQGDTALHCGVLILGPAEHPVDFNMPAIHQYGAYTATNIWLDIKSNDLRPPSC